MSKVQLHYGDCLEILPTLETNSIDVVITDPEFFLPPAGSNARGNKEWRGSIGHLAMFEGAYRPIFEELHRLVRPTGQLYINCHDRSYPSFYRIAYGLWPKVSLIVWYKPTGRVGSGWRRSHELIMHCTWQKPEYTPGFRQDVIGIMPVRTLNREHPAQKPGDLVEFLFEAVPEGAIVLDAFMGSGTTGVSCVKTGRPFIGIEVDPGYFELAKRNIETAQAEMIQASFTQKG